MKIRFVISLVLVAFCWMQLCSAAEDSRNNSRKNAKPSLIVPFISACIVGLGAMALHQFLKRPPMISAKPIHQDPSSAVFEKLALTQSSRLWLSSVEADAYDLTQWKSLSANRDANMNPSKTVLELFGHSDQEVEIVRSQFDDIPRIESRTLEAMGLPISQIEEFRLRLYYPHFRSLIGIPLEALRIAILWKSIFERSGNLQTEIVLEVVSGSLDRPQKKILRIRPFAEAKALLAAFHDF